MARTRLPRPLAARRRAAFGSVVLSAGLVLLAGSPSAGAAPTPGGASPAPATSGSYAPVGTPVEGGTDPASGAVLPGPGQYTDVLPAGSATTATDGAVKYYSVTLHRGDKAFLSATVVTPVKPTSGTSISVDLELSSLDNDSCYFDNSNYDSESGNLISPVSVELATGVVGGPGWNSDCPVSGTFVIKVTRSGDAYRSDPTPLELGYHLEPKVVSSGVPGIAPSASDVPVQPGDGAVNPIRAGFSFDDAPTVGTGRYRDTITSGQTRYFRVPLTWGQRLGFLATSTRVSANNGGGAWATASLYSPIRAPLDLADGSSDDVETSFGGSDGRLAGTTRALVRYANRTSADDQIAPYSVAGDYYVALSLGYADNDVNGTSPLTVPYTLVLDVIGRSEAAPIYSYSPVVDAASTGSGSGSHTAVWIAAVVALVAAVVAAAWFVLMRRRRPGHAGVRSGSGSAPTTGFPARTPPPQGPPPQGPPPQGPPRR